MQRTQHYPCLQMCHPEEVKQTLVVTASFCSLLNYDALSLSICSAEQLQHLVKCKSLLHVHS